MTRRPQKKQHNKVSITGSLPNELVCEVLSRVAASSLTDIVNVKLSSKKLKEIGEDKYVYQHVLIPWDKFPIVEWEPLSQDQHIFLHKCLESGNPHMMYRQALVDYFNKANLASTYQKLDRAVKLGHVGAMYVTCIVLLLSGNEEYKQKGIELLSNMKRSASLKRKLRLCRNNLINQLKRMWVYNPALKDQPICCTVRHQHQLKNQWDEEDDDKCEACNADREVKFICATYNTI